MRKTPDTFLIVSIEASCWEKPLDQPIGQKNEIIEIGAAHLSLTKLTIGNSHNFIIKPSKSTISEFCTRITGLTQARVDKGMSFAEACVLLTKKLNSINMPFITYGEFDKKIFKWQCDDMKIQYPFPSHWDFSQTFAKMMGLEHEVSLPVAMKLMGLEFEGMRHKGRDEAYNIARLMAETFKRIRGNNEKQHTKEAKNKN
jgi:inhibitor of KinA sporulation pathway (predicted exonuclease)